MNFYPSFMPIGIGSLPYKDPYQASETILNHFPESPYWPQLPSKGWKEGMLAQFTEGMPGLAIEEEKIYFHTPFNPPSEWERFHELSQEGNEDHFGIGKEYASGFHTMLELVKSKAPKLVKGQLTGPVTLGLGLLDEKRIPILYDPNLIEMLLKILSLRARWQEKEFRKVAPDAETLIFFDEPFLSSYGSISMNLSKREIIGYLREAVSSLRGLSGIHVCGATDWSIIIETGIKVIHFDAYRYFPNMLAYASELKDFFLHGGILGWGIVPSEEEYIKAETISNLMKSLEEKIGLLVKEGVPEEFLMRSSLLSQSCGLASISEELAEKALSLTRDLSFEMKRRFNSKLFS